MVCYGYDFAYLDRYMADGLVELKLETVTFKSIDSIFKKERSGVKPNTSRAVDWEDERFRILARMALGYICCGYIRIENAEQKGINFTRKIKDITFFGNLCIVSWEVFKVFVL